MRHFYSFVLLLFVGLNVQAQATDFVTGLSNPHALLVYEDVLYFTETNGNRIRKIDLTDQNPVPELVVSGIPSPYGLARWGTELFFAHGPGFDKISKIDITDPNPTPTLVAQNLDFPIGLEARGRDLYIAEFHGARISKIDVSLPNPTVVEVISGVDGPYGLEVVGDDLFISSWAEDKVLKVDVTDPNPTLTEVIAFLDLPVGLKRYGTYLLIAEAGESIGQDIISKIDRTLQNPTSTTLVSGLYNPTSGLEVHGMVLYIAEDFKISIFDLPLSTDEFDLKNVSVLPNPTSDSITISGLTDRMGYTIYDISGTVLDKGVVASDEEINVQQLSTGLYFLILNNTTVKKFVKK